MDIWRCFYCNINVCISILFALILPFTHKEAETKTKKNHYPKLCRQNFFPCLVRRFSGAYRGRGKTVKSSNTHVFEVPQGMERKRMWQMLELKR